MKRFLVSISLLFCSLASSSGFIIVGNGGEGVMVDGRIYNRDLYDFENHLNPWIGQDRDPAIARALKDWNPLLLSEFEKDLLVRKLSDLERAKNHLGQVLAQAFRVFSWSFTDGDLVLIQPDQIRKMVAESQRVSIANRYGQTVLVHKVRFDSLGGANKTALLIHEIVYALLRTGPESQPPSLATTRQIVAGFFNYESLNNQGFLRFVTEEFQIPKPLPLETVFPEDEKVTVSYLVGPDEQDEKSLKLFATERYFSAKTNKFCDVAFDETPNDAPVSKILFFEKAAVLRLNWQPYKGLGSVTHYRLSVSRESPMASSALVKNHFECQWEVAQFLRKSLQFH